MTTDVNLTNLHKHLFITSSYDIASICEPLKTHLGITSFVYQRNFSDATEIRLSNQPAWIEHYYQSKLYTESVFEHQPQQYQAGFVLWSSIDTHTNILSAAREFNIDHGITLIAPQSDGVEFYFLGTTRDKPFLVNQYLNNLDLLQRFIPYFKQRAEPLLKKAQASKLFIPNKKVKVPPEKIDLLQLTSTNFRENFISITQLDSQRTLQKSQTLKLSRREIEVAIEIILGSTRNEMAVKFSISPRTVESHINNIKNKLGCTTRSELIKILFRHGFNKLAMSALKD